MVDAISGFLILCFVVCIGIYWYDGYKEIMSQASIEHKCIYVGRQHKDTLIESIIAPPFILVSCKVI